ncbi:NADPH-dependent F420 reductase [Halocatena halophila]|uniref:NADPH-dependent F420 reductase n=1 Tax=Halocatena halophila TaxID=2814576 RepID=UPI002ED573C0
MEIALLGGTGDIGEGLALRFIRDTDHTIHIGSRTPEKATASADAYATRLGDDAGEITGSSNQSAAERASVIVCSVPPEYVVSTIESIESSLNMGDVLVSPAVSMNRGPGGFVYDPPAAGSVAQAAAQAAPDDVPVVGAFQNLAAGALASLETAIEADVVVTGDDEAATATVTELASELDGIRAIDGGGLSATASVEALTPLLINLAMNNDGMHDLGVRFE